MPINHNGTIHNSDAIGLTSSNRAFRYGDALFETMRVFEGKITFWKAHWDRLLAGAKFMRYEQLQSEAFYQNEIQKLCRMEGNWRIRMTVYRTGGGLYTPQSNNTAFLIESQELAQNHFLLNETGLNIDICDSIKLPASPAFNWKTANSLFYILAGIYKQDQHLDDCLLLNERDNIAEASSSNLFIVKGNELRTPPLRSGCKAGTTRSIMLQLAPELGLIVKEKKIKEKHLFEAEEIWLTNAIQGIRWTGQFREQKYANTQAQKMTMLLNQQLAKN